MDVISSDFLNGTSHTGSVDITCTVVGKVCFKSNSADCDICIFTQGSLRLCLDIFRVARRGQYLQWKRYCQISTGGHLSTVTQYKNITLPNDTPGSVKTESLSRVIMRQKVESVLNHKHTHCESSEPVEWMSGIWVFWTGGRASPSPCCLSASLLTGRDAAIGRGGRACGTERDRSSWRMFTAHDQPLVTWLLPWQLSS